MKPKELPKTCGNCGNVEMTVHKVRCPHRRYPMEKFRDWIGYPRYEHYAEDSACENYVSSSDSLEQRHQQLAEVAKSLYVLAWSDKMLLMHEPRHGDERIKAADDAMASYRERLEQLGVIVDD